MVKWWKTNCPICGEETTVPTQKDIRYCRDCKFQWSTELEEHVLIVLAADHVRKGK